MLNNFGMEDIVWSNQADSILSIGTPLFNIGIQNWALTKDQAFEAIEKLSIQNIAVLGGDVFEIKEVDLEMNYDNWYCVREEGESVAEYVNRSLKTAKQFISHYTSHGIKEAFFALVPDVED